MTELVDIRIEFGDCLVCRICAMQTVDYDYLGVGGQLYELFVASILFRRQSRR